MGRGGQRVSEIGYLGRIPGPVSPACKYQFLTLDEAALASKASKCVKQISLEMWL